MDKTRLIALLRDLRPRTGAQGKPASVIADHQEEIDAAIEELERVPSQQAVAWENPSTHAILRDESPDMCDNRRDTWRALVYRASATPVDKTAIDLLKRAARYCEPALGTEIALFFETYCADEKARRPGGYPVTDLEVLEKALNCNQNGDTADVGKWLGLLRERLTAVAAHAREASPVGSVLVKLEGPPWQREVSEPVFSISPEFEATLDGKPGVPVELYAHDAPFTAQAHQRAAEAIAIAKAAIDVMTEFHSHAIPDDSPDMDAVFAAEHFRAFVDEHARLMFRVREFKAYPVDSAYLRLRGAAQGIVDLLEGVAPATERATRFKALRDAVYGTHDGIAGLARPAYIDDAGAVYQPGERGLGRLDGLGEAAAWLECRAGTSAAQYQNRKLADGLRGLKAAPPFGFVPKLVRWDARVAASHGGTPPEISQAELQQFDRAVEQIRANASANCDPGLLLRWAAMGLLESVGFEPTQTGYALLESKLGTNEADED